MLTNTNRAGIRNSLKQWSQRRNIPDEVLNDFIELALSKANRALRIPPLEAVSSIPFDTNGYLALPSNFIEVKQLRVTLNDKNIILERKHIDEVDYLAGRLEGDPCYFGRFGNYFRVAPYDSSITDATLYYWYAIPPMPDDTTTNWFTQYAPEVLLYGALQELADYTKDGERSAQWAAKFNEAISILQAMEDRAAWSGSTIGIRLGGSS